MSPLRYSAGHFSTIFPTKDLSIGNGIKQMTAASGSGVGDTRFTLTAMLRKLGELTFLRLPTIAFVMMGSGVRIT